MKPKHLFFLLIYFSVVSVQAQLSEVQSQKIDNLFNSWTEANHPAGAIGIIQNGEIIYSKTFGLASLEYQVPNKIETIFNTGSISKQFTATGIMLLHKKGLLSIDDDMRKHLPDMPDFGHTIMDDASGNYFGRQLIRDYYFNHMPEDIRVAFADKYNVEDDYIKYNLYKQPNPNAYLASFAEFMFLNKDSEYVTNLIKNGIRLFARNMILQFKEELKTVPVHFAGSIAFFSQDEIREVAKEMDFTVGNFERRPIEGLVSYHTKNI